ncbi:MAG: hypothetical protein CVV25_14220 [Ignavibacteriae bacterium HGW-Ignavibacteriae-4]|nr:MAG: hypothetical protein CVV25_14220 [Ignavibacteriae bacterium HGW-Ignavibacteriae-4]
MEIKDSVILITGAATRVGREVALCFAEKGANISFSYYLEDEPWQETLHAIEAYGDAIVPAPVPSFPFVASTYT